MASKEMENNRTKHSDDKNNRKKPKLTFQPVSEMENDIGQYSIVFDGETDDNRNKFNETRARR